MSGIPSLSIICLLFFTICGQAWPSSPPRMSFGRTASPLQASSDAATADKNGPKQLQAVVVGGGPVGLAAALTLSNAPHCYNVIVLEQSPVLKRFDPTKAYVYGITSRGLNWMEECCPKALDKLAKNGTAWRPMKDAALIVADPTKPLPQSASVEMQAFGQVDTGGAQNYWIPRHSMLELLQELIQEQEDQRTQQAKDTNLQENQVGSIQLIPSQLCQSLQVNDNTGMVDVFVKDTTTNKVRSFSGHLVVGADGVNSVVRECLGGRHDSTKDDKTPSSWLTAQPEKFKVKKWNSQSSGLRMKVLQIPSNFPLQDVDGTMVETDKERLYSIKSVTNGPYNQLRLGLLPIRIPYGNTRTANSITRPSHEIWKLSNGPQAKEWYIKAFPRLDWDALIPNDDEWERFAQAKGTTFPPCQYSTGLQISSSTSDNADDAEPSVGVVLVGDALHAFPPDLGQGINSGFSDLVALDKALRSTATAEEALQQYERVHGPEAKALIRLARIGAPYQYRQSLRKDRIGHFLWTLNVALRLLLNKISWGFLPPPALIMSMDKKLTFRQVMRRADLTTAGLYAAGTWLLCRTRFLQKVLLRRVGWLANIAPFQIALAVLLAKVGLLIYAEMTR